jgi:hypothetical protein
MNDLFERIVDRVLNYKPPPQTKKQIAGRKKKKAK